MRVSRGFSPETDVLFADDSNTSVEFLLKPNAKARALCKEHTQSIDPVRVRAVRVVLPAKKTKSNVVQQSWTIEGDFRHQKSRLQLENWTGKRAATVWVQYFQQTRTRELELE